MRRIAIATVLALLSIECHAQMPGMMGPGAGGPNPGQCEQVRGAIQQYGLQAARQHAMANYGLSATDVRNVEQQCGIGGGERSGSKRARQ
jgi:hypothetical protein